MFERVVLRRVDDAPEIDIGLLAETLLFYGQTHIILDVVSSVGFARQVGIDNMKRLVEAGHARFTYFQDRLVVLSETKNNVSLHGFAQLRWTVHKNGKAQKWDRRRDLEEMMTREGFDVTEAVRASKKLLEIAPLEKMKLSGDKIDIVGMATEDLRDQQYVDRSVKIALSRMLGGATVPSHWRFRLHPVTANQFFIETNFDHSAINRTIKSINPNADDFDAARLLGDILEARADLIAGSKHMAEIITNDARSMIIQGKFDLSNLRRLHSAKEISLFQNMYLEGRTLREVINSGERTFTEFLDVLDEAQKFKTWASGVTPEAGLVKEYYEAVTRSSWLDRLPTKGARFVWMTGVGMLADVMATGGFGTALGLGLSAADTFLLDRLLTGWRPNHFVENELSPFVAS